MRVVMGEEEEEEEEELVGEEEERVEGISGSLYQSRIGVVVVVLQCILLQLHNGLLQPSVSKRKTQKW